MERTGPSIIALLRIRRFITIITTGRLLTSLRRQGWRSIFMAWAWRSAITTTTALTTFLLPRSDRIVSSETTATELLLTLRSRLGLLDRMNSAPVLLGWTTIATGILIWWWRIMCSGRRRTTFIARLMKKRNRIARRNLIAGLPCGCGTTAAMA